MSQLTLDRASLEALNEHVASAARLVGQIQDGTAPGGTLDLLAETIDKIGYELGELLGELHGNPHVFAANARRRTEDAAPAIALVERVPNAPADAT